MTFRPPRSTPRLAAMMLAVALVGGACSGDTPEPETPEASPSTEAGPPPVTTRITLGRTTGRLSAQEKRRLKRAVGTVVDGWLDAAYLAGEYPRTDFADAFPGFTAGARADARRDKDLMSNHDIGRRVDVVQATRRRLRVDALVVDGRAVSSTARVMLTFRTDGDVARRFEVSGRLFLSRADGWRIFGYDVTKGAAR